MFSTTGQARPYILDAIEGIFNPFDEDFDIRICIMKDLSRRKLFSLVSGGVLAAGLLAGCTTTTVGSKTTASISVAKINAYVTAGLNAATTVGTTLTLFPELAKYAEPLNKAVSTLQSASDEFLNATGGTLVISYDDASVKTVVDSVFNGIQQILDVIGAVAIALAKGGLPISLDTITRVQVARDALATVVAVFKALIVTSFTSNTGTHMHAGVPFQLANNEHQALKTLGV
jgi:hypothetical protein